MNPREYAELASQLASKERPTIAELRTSVSRAYYSAFNVAIEFRKGIGVTAPEGWEGHKLVAEALRYSGDDKIGAASRELDDLRKARWAADYDMLDDHVEHQRSVQKWAARSRQINKKLDDCTTEEARLASARVKIRTWAGSVAGAGKRFTVF
jgi:hypothetical protein